MAIDYSLVVLAVLPLVCFQDSFQQESTNPQTSTSSEPLKLEAIPHDTDGSVETSPLATNGWTPPTVLASESRRRRPGKGWGGLAPVLLAASTILPLLLTALAALAGKALMSSILALAVAGFNLFRSTQSSTNNGA